MKSDSYFFAYCVTLLMVTTLLIAGCSGDDEPQDNSGDPNAGQPNSPQDNDAAPNSSESNASIDQQCDGVAEFNDTVRWDFDTSCVASTCCEETQACLNDERCMQIVDWAFHCAAEIDSTGSINTCMSHRFDFEFGNPDPIYRDFSFCMIDDCEEIKPHDHDTCRPELALEVNEKTGWNFDEQCLLGDCCDDAAFCAEDEACLEEFDCRYECYASVAAGDIEFGAESSDCFAICDDAADTERWRLRNCLNENNLCPPRDEFDYSEAGAIDATIDVGSEAIEINSKEIVDGGPNSLRITFYSESMIGQGTQFTIMLDPGIITTGQSYNCEDDEGVWLIWSEDHSMPSYFADPFHGECSFELLQFDDSTIAAQFEGTLEIEGGSGDTLATSGDFDIDR